jgi:hypothetical protein
MPNRKGSALALVLICAVSLSFPAARAPAADSTRGEREAPWWLGKRIFWSTENAERVKPHEPALRAKEQLDRDSRMTWGNRWHPLSGLPDGLWGGGPSEIERGSPEATARAFVERYRPLFTGIEAESDPGDIVFEVIGTKEQTWGEISVRFRELYRGVPVAGAGPVIAVDTAGHVAGMGRTPYKVENLSVTPAFSAEEAKEVFRKAFLPDSAVAGNRSEPTLYIYPTPTRPRLAYLLQGAVFSATYADGGMYYIDAHSGEPLGFLASSTAGPLKRRP